MSAPRFVDCRCAHPKREHEVEGLAPQCTHRGCTCVQYRPATAPARLGQSPAGAIPAPAASPIRPSAVPNPRTIPGQSPATPSDEPTAEQLIAAGKRSQLKRINALAAKVETELGELSRRLSDERAAAEAKRKKAEEREAAQREIRRLEQQLAAARERLKSTRHELGLSGGERASDGVNQCPDCPETFATAQRLGVHRRWKHDYRRNAS